LLGQGTMGTVYAAKDLRTGRRVAIKSLHLRGALDPKDPDLLRFQQEARIAGALDSQHVVEVLDVELDPPSGAPYLVMELLRGEDLQSLLDRVGPLPVKTASRIAAQACAGLVAAHAAGVVHRDIKPGNLFLARREAGQIVVKIVDFGIAKIRRLPPDAVTGAASGALVAPQVSMTESGQLLGSPLYMSPEQVEGTKGIDARSDVFSLGVTLFAMLAGKPPHADVKGFALLLSRISTEPVPSIRGAAPGVGPEVAALIERATRLPREERFAGAAEMLEAMQPLLSGSTALREEMLIGRGDEPEALVEIEAEVDPHARTALVRAEERPPPAGRGSSNRWIVGAAVVAMLVVTIAVAAALWWR